MKVKDIPMLKQKVIEMLPITQSLLWKNLKISSRDGSELVSIMVEENLIKKTKSDNTFLLEKISGGNGNGKKEIKDEDKGFIVLLSSKGRFSPCCACQLECDAANCHILSEWIEEI